MNWLRPLQVAALAAGLAAPVGAAEVDLDGRVALRALFSADGLQITDRAETVFISFLETDAAAMNLTDGGLNLKLDSTFVLDATDTRERRFGRTESLDQVRQAYVEQPDLFGGRLDVVVGRRLIAEAGNGWVDGLELRLNLTEGVHVGVYGGLAPDPIDYSLVLDRQAAGAYFDVKLAGLDVALAYNAEFSTRDAETLPGRNIDLDGDGITDPDFVPPRLYPAPEDPLDRHYAFGRVHLRITDDLYLATYAVVDMAVEPQITTLLGSLDYSPGDLELTVNVSRYSLARYRDEIIYQNVIEPNQALVLGDEVLDLSYDRARVSAAYRFGSGRWYHYQSVEYKRRSLDGLDAWHYTIGLRDNDLFGLAIRSDLQAQFRNNFVSDSALVALDLQYDLGSSVTLDGRFTWFDGQSVDNERARAFDEAQRVLLMGLSVAWRINRQHQVDALYDGIYETELQDARNEGSLFIHTGMVRYNYLF